MPPLVQIHAKQHKRLNLLDYDLVRRAKSYGYQGIDASESRSAAAGCFIFALTNVCFCGSLSDPKLRAADDSDETNLRNNLFALEKS